MIASRRPVIGVLCCNEVASRPVQVVASRFVDPLSALAGAAVLLVPAISGAADVPLLADLLDGLLLTGSRSHVAPRRYGDRAGHAHHLDEERDEVALALADRMIEAAKPVFGICRGLQEINVLFGGTLSANPYRERHHAGAWDGDYAQLFDHCHDVSLSAGGRLSAATGVRRLTVNSVHEQGIDRLGGGLAVEAIASDDGLVEAISARPCGAPVLAVQWHPEWNAGQSVGGRAFFALVREALHDAVARRPVGGRTTGALHHAPRRGPSARQLRGH
ncbi:putative glutamine amidotransferase [Sphingomonas gellani]|uniref:Putative glutamine amidotransferase n=1 Tax=Sphingomonas gellani TaxID=1166340 RepID=A0A1H8JAK7_9SPHN|nr:gamma-glutamyl-gamma-aminobutyrate hydrolase family protein [Sphingomonas gellani]SEN77148.1 putative glutamine amidotransferase [Sphingomonas gellani]